MNSSLIPKWCAGLPLGTQGLIERRNVDFTPHKAHCCLFLELAVKDIHELIF